MTDKIQVKTRFAPSPTGFLHIGGARTALFNYLFAKSHNGKFVLRVEDTDLERSTEESTKAILDGMAWLELDFDEGPFYQSKRTKIYKEHIEKLLSTKHAYKCYCTKDELEARREEAKKKGIVLGYDGKCRDRTDTPDEPFTIRFKVEEGTTIFNDLIKGPIETDHSQIDDFIIARSDGSPTYNLTVTVDDALMAITHVIRGDDHISNTPKQILMYKALNFDVPEMAHLPMILGEDKTRLSKRHGATSVMAYKDLGYLPHALINYLARLGWSSRDEEIFSMDDLIEKFTLKNVGKSSGVFNPEKLDWLNSHYIKEMNDKGLTEIVTPFLLDKGYDLNKVHNLEKAVATLKERATTLKEMAKQASFYFNSDFEINKDLKEKHLTEDKKEFLIGLKNKFINTTDNDFDEEDKIKDSFKEYLKEVDLKMGKLAPALRLALTGTMESPGIFEVACALGKDETVKRIESMIGKI